MKNKKILCSSFDDVYDHINHIRREIYNNICDNQISMSLYWRIRTNIPENRRVLRDCTESSFGEFINSNLCL
jgi:hypothetical protein